MSVRNDIIENVITTLETVTGIEEVSRYRRLWSDWGGNEQWAKAALYEGYETSQPRIGCNIYDHTWFFGVRLFYKGEKAQENIDNLLGDVREAMLESGSIIRGGYAWNTLYIGTEQAEDIFEEDRLKASVLMNFSISYREIY